MGQQHEGHRRAVAVELAVVLPEAPTATLGLTDVVHGLHQVAVLRIGVLALVARVVPLGPRSDEARAVDLETHPAVGTIGRRLAQGDGRAVGRRRSSPPPSKAPTAATGTPIPGRSGSQTRELADRPRHLADADGREQVEAQVVEGQGAGVPEPSLGQKDEHGRCGQRDGDEDHAESLARS